MDRNLEAKKYVTLKKISTFAHFTFTDSGVEARPLWGHPEMFFFPVVELARSWPEWKTTPENVQWTGAVSGPIAVLRQPFTSPAATRTAAVLVAENARKLFNCEPSAALTTRTRV